MTHAFTLLATLLSSACFAASSPEDVARRYIEASALGDQRAISAELHAGCTTPRVATGSWARILDVPITIDELVLTPTPPSASRATVSYQLRGHVQARQVDTTTRLFGKQVTIKVDGLSLDKLDLSGSLDLKKADGRWQISCLPAPTKAQ